MADAAIVPALLVHEPVQFAVLVAKGHATTYFRALAGLFTLLPTLPRDRALAKRIRRRRDRDLLVSAPMVARDDLVGSGLLKRGKLWYEGALDAYWRFLTRTVLR